MNGVKRYLLVAAGILCSLLTIQAVTVNFHATQMPENLGEMEARTASGILQSGDGVSIGTNVTFTVPYHPDYAVEWFVNDTRQRTTGVTLVLTVTHNVTVEAHYHKPYKFVFAGTPYVKYAGPDGYATLTRNYYHHDYVQEKGITHTVDYWTGDNGKTYAVDNDLTDNQWTRELLTGDVVLTPHYTLSGKDIGDATTTVTWSFDQPDSMALFDEMKSVAPYVQPVSFEQGTMTDVVMTIDATKGGISNAYNGLWWSYPTPARVAAGTRFTIPSLYGTDIVVLTQNALSATTIAGRTDYARTQLSEDLYQSTLHYYASADSIEIVAGEDLFLVSIAATYPGGVNELVWMPEVGVAKTTIGTLQKTGSAGALLCEMTDITNNGPLRITASKADSLTSLIEVPLGYNPDRYMSVGFQIADGYAFQLTQAVVPFMPVTNSSNVQVALALVDETNQRIDSLFTKQTSNVVNNDSLVFEAPSEQRNGTYLQGKVQLNIYAYGVSCNYRLGTAIRISGQLYQRIAFPENSTWMPFVMTSGIDFDGTDLRNIEIYEVVGVREKKGFVTKIPLEECPPGSVVLLHAPEPGMVCFVPLTRCDDAFDQSVNILKISDGTVVGDETRYVFGQKDGKAVFLPTTAGTPIPQGEVYLEYDFVSTPEMVYLSEDDALGIDSVENDEAITKTHIRRLVKDGRIYIVTPDGTTYNLAGVRVNLLP